MDSIGFAGSKAKSSFYQYIVPAAQVTLNKASGAGNILAEKAKNNDLVGNISGRFGSKSQTREIKSQLIGADQGRFFLGNQIKEGRREMSNEPRTLTFRVDNGQKSTDDLMPVNENMNKLGQIFDNNNANITRSVALM